MKKYLSLAILLGLIAFISVSYLAQAQNGMEKAVESAAPEAAAIAENTSNEAVSADVARFMQNAETCETELAASTEDMTQEAHDKAFTDCMVKHGHNAEEVKARYFDNQPDAPVAP